MPGFDGTGPGGLGPGTGRGRGKCVGGVSHLFNKAFSTIILPAIGVVVNDVRRPDGVTRRLYNSLKTSILNRTNKRIEQKQNNLLVPENQENEIHNKEI